MTVKYWEIREDRKIVALIDFWGIKAGDVGGTVGADVTLPPDTSPMWVGEHLSWAPVW
jgi:hypothetical protein